MRISYSGVGTFFDKSFPYAVMPPRQVVLALAALVGTADRPEFLAVADSQVNGGRRWDVAAIEGERIVLISGESEDSDWSWQRRDDAATTKATMLNLNDLETIETDSIHIDVPGDEYHCTFQWTIVTKGGQRHKLPIVLPYGPSGPADLVQRIQNRIAALPTRQAAD